MKTPVRTRLLSALLSLVMLVSLLPVSVFAAEPEAGTAHILCHYAPFLHSGLRHRDLPTHNTEYHPQLLPQYFSASAE